MARYSSISARTLSRAGKVQGSSSIIKEQQETIKRQYERIRELESQLAKEALSDDSGYKKLFGELHEIMIKLDYPSPVVEQVFSAAQGAELPYSSIAHFSAYCSNS